MSITTDERKINLLAELQKERIKALYARYPEYCNEEEGYDKDEDNARCLGLDQTPYND